MYPGTLEQQGVSFTQMQKDPELALRKIEEYHFQDALENFAQELEFLQQRRINIQSSHILHFGMPDIRPRRDEGPL